MEIDEPDRHLAVRLAFVRVVVGEVSREAEVGHLADVFLAHQHVAGGEVSVHYLVLREVVHPLQSIILIQIFIIKHYI